MRNADRVPALDGIRGLAATLVLIRHCTGHGLFVPHSADDLGDVGVAVFFTLSGFLMSHLYGDAEFNFQSVKGYMVSRAARIAPLYLAVVVVSYFVTTVIGPTFIYHLDNSNILRHLFFMGNVDVFWTIPPECQFYAFFILIWWGFNSLLKGRFGPILIVFAMSLGMLLIGPFVAGTLLPSKCSFFLAGTLAGYGRKFLPKFTLSKGVMTAVELPIVMVVIFYPRIIAFLIHQIGTSYLFGMDVYNSPICAPIVAVAILVFSNGAGFVSSLLSVRMIRLLGQWSFSLYLLHDVIVDFIGYIVSVGSLNPWVAGCLAVVSSVAISRASYKYIEMPLQNLTRNSLSNVARA